MEFEYMRKKQQAMYNQTFSYLDLFEQQQKVHKQAQDEFYQAEQEEESEADSKKPAMFRNDKEEQSQPLSQKAEEVKAWQNLQKQLHMEFDPETKSQEELREFFKISKDKNAIDHMNEQMFDYLYDRMKDRQIKFYAFLNKEFNIMNFKSARCSMHCFDSNDKSVKDVNECLQVCRSGISGCRDFAFNLQKTAEEDLEKCQDESKNLKNLKDPVIHWISCYEKLIIKFDDMEKHIRDEFTNFI